LKTENSVQSEASDSVRVSVVTPSYNQLCWLPACLSSVHSQDYPGLEHIVVDGGSTDGSVDVINRYGSRLAYSCSEPDGGQYDAINKGFDRSTGDIMAWLNADDLYLPWTLRTVVSVFNALPQVEWIASTVVAQISSAGAAFTAGAVRPPCRAAFLDGFYIPGPSDAIGCLVQEGVFWRRSLWERSKARLSVARGLAADFDLWCQFYRHAEAYGIAVPLAAMTRHSQQRSNNSCRYQAECRDSLTELRADIGYRARWLGLKHAILRLPILRSLIWRLAKRAFDYRVNAVYPEVDPCGYQTGWSTKSFRLIL
jgi:glycosyltransferase involved in cell wall biosynthesis